MAEITRLLERTQAFPDVNATLRLVKAFMAIEDEEARNDLLSVVEAMAQTSVGVDKAVYFELRASLSTMIERLG